MKGKLDVSWQNIEGLLFALTPFFRNYRIPYVDMNLATFLFLIMISVDLFDRVCLKKKSADDFSKSVALLVLICMTGYMLIEYVLIDVMKIGSYATAGNFWGLLLYLFEIWGLLFAFSDASLRGKFRKKVIEITLFMCFVIFIQCLLYYLFDIALTRSFFVPFNGLCEQSVTEVLDQSSMVMNGLFRPSAFFLEPSHFAAYAVIALGILLFENDKKINRKAIIITISILMTTSGLGMAASMLLWGIKALEFLSSKNRLRLRNTLIVCFAALCVFIVLYFAVDPFQRAVNRVLISDNQNAITGRLWTSFLLDKLSGVDMYLGLGFRNRPVSEYSGSVYYMTGSVEMLYCQGLMGMVIFTILMVITVYRMWKKKDILNFSIICVFIAWFMLGNIINPYYLVKYLPFTFHEADIDTTKEQLIN